MIFFLDPSKDSGMASWSLKLTKELLFLKCRVSKLPGEFSGFIFSLPLLTFLKTCFVGRGNREKAGLCGNLKGLFSRDALLYR